jgi:hypothetical protein
MASAEHWRQDYGGGMRVGNGAAIEVVNLERQEHSHSDATECRGGQP